MSLLVLQNVQNCVPPASSILISREGQIQPSIYLIHEQPHPINKLTLNPDDLHLLVVWLLHWSVSIHAWDGIYY
jgi:hypothetical protein